MLGRFSILAFSSAGEKNTWGDYKWFCLLLLGFSLVLRYLLRQRHYDFTLCFTVSYLKI